MTSAGYDASRRYRGKEESVNTDSLPALAVAHLRNVNMGPDIVEYLERIDATLEPYGGRFLVHGGPIEGDWTGDLIIVQFPSRGKARASYESAADQAIAPLRARNADGELILIETVPADHRATGSLARTCGGGRRIDPHNHGPDIGLGVTHCPSAAARPGTSRGGKRTGVVRFRAARRAGHVERPRRGGREEAGAVPRGSPDGGRTRSPRCGRPASGALRPV